MNCPKCSGSLVRRELESVTVDECRACRGIWFDRDELRLAKDSADPDNNWLDFEVWKHTDRVSASQSSAGCPACETPLVALIYGDTTVEIDHCPNCEGTWLDSGEFQKIVDDLLREILTKSFSDYVKAALEEAKEIITGPETLWSEWKDFATVFRLMQCRFLVENPAAGKAIVVAGSASPIR